MSPSPSGVITLLTDFGLSDPFVGVMHGVILSRFPAGRVVDLSHGVAPQAVDEAAFWLERSYRWFPPGSVHVVVVDPEVGTARAALVVAAHERFFVAPDNGLLGEIAHTLDAEVRHVDLERVGLGPPSRTFHGRDVFAPLAAELAAGRLAFEGVGPPGGARRLSPAAGPRVVSVDRFGNLITDIEASALAAFARPVVVVAGRELPIAGTYAEVPDQEAVALVSSFDTLEIAVRNGNASSVLGVQRGAGVFLREATPNNRLA